MKIISLSRCLHFNSDKLFTQQPISSNIQEYVWHVDHFENYLVRQMGQHAAVTQRYLSTMFRLIWCMFLSTSSIMSGELCLSLDADSDGCAFYSTRTSQRWFVFCVHCNNMAHSPMAMTNRVATDTDAVDVDLDLDADLDDISGRLGRQRSQILFSYRAHCDPEEASHWYLKSIDLAVL